MQPIMSIYNLPACTTTPIITIASSGTITLTNAAAAICSFTLVAYPPAQYTINCSKTAGTLGTGGSVVVSFFVVNHISA